MTSWLKTNMSHFTHCPEKRPLCVSVMAKTSESCRLIKWIKFVTKIVFRSPSLDSVTVQSDASPLSVTCRKPKSVRVLHPRLVRRKMKTNQFLLGFLFLFMKLSSRRNETCRSFRADKIRSSYNMFMIPLLTLKRNTQIHEHTNNRDKYYNSFVRLMVIGGNVCKD